jgi:hypothetical protein
LLDQPDFTGFLKALGTDVAGILRVDRVRLVLESRSRRPRPGPHGPEAEDVLTVVTPGFVEEYITGGPRRADRRSRCAR